MPSSTARVVLHVGLPKTGTTFLQGLMADHRDTLRAAGVLYPFVRPGAMFHGAVEVRGSHAKFGLDADRVAGAWAAVCGRALSFLDDGGTAVISHEVLAGATPDEVRRALAPLAGAEVHVVVTARDLGRQATAHWQEEVKLGRTWSFADFEREQLRADTGPDLDTGAGPDAGGVRPHFWHAQDFADCLRRWSTSVPGAVPAERAHLVVAPGPGAPPEVLWQRFAAACGVDPSILDAGAAPASNPSLGAAEVALLRAVNAGLAGRLDRATYLRVVKREYAEGELAARPGPRARAPYELGALLGGVTERWLEQVRTAGHPVHGDAADLVPLVGGAGEPGPDDASPADDPDRVVEILVGRGLRGASLG